MIKANRSDHTAARGAMSSEVKGGLEDVVVSTSDICYMAGREGRLLYRGYDVNDLVEHSSFEEVVYLLWHGALPSRKELAAHVKVLSATATRKLPPGLIVLLRALPKKTTPMEVLRTGVSALSAFDPDAADNSREATARKAVRLTAQMPTLVAAWERIRRGKPLVAPNPKLSLAANFLGMLRGGAATALEGKTFDVALMLHADHEFNASTFAARGTAATMADLYSGAAYKSMGTPTDQFTPIFAISRVAGWAAHVMEQHANNRLIRPRAEYTGPTHATYVPIDRR